MRKILGLFYIKARKLAKVLRLFVSIRYNALLELIALSVLLYRRDVN